MKLYEVVKPLLESFKIAKEKFLEEYDDERTIEYTLEQFKSHRQRVKPPKNDISYWIKQGFYKFYLFVDELSNTPTKKQKQKQIERAKDDIEVILDDENAKAVIPLSRNSSCYHGRHSDWCITKDQNEHFADRIGRGIVFVFIETKDESLIEKYPELSLVALEVNEHAGHIESIWDMNNNSLDEYRMTTRYSFVNQNENADEYDQFLLRLTRQAREFFINAVEDMGFGLDSELEEERIEQEEREIMHIVHNLHSISQVFGYFEEYHGSIELDPDEVTDIIHIAVLNGYKTQTLNEEELAEYVIRIWDGEWEMAEKLVMARIDEALINRFGPVAFLVSEYVGYIKKWDENVDGADRVEQYFVERLKALALSDSDHIEYYIEQLHDYVGYMSDIRGMNQLDTTKLNHYFKDILKHKEKYGTDIHQHNQSLF